MKSLSVDYKKELESASKGMIMIHDPKLLIKLIVRMIVSKVQIKHAGMILYESDRDCYVLNISRGERGLKIPIGFARFDHSNPIIQLFSKPEYRYLRNSRNAILTHDVNRLLWQESMIDGGNGLRDLLHSLDDQMRMLNTVACVPALYRNHLLAVLLLGERADGKKFTQQELNFFSALASDAAMAIRNAQLFMGLKKESQRNHDLFIRTTEVLASAIEAKDRYTHGHTDRVTNYALAIARQMNENGTADFNEEFMESLYIAGILHDIGKIGIPESILNKTGKLTEEEFSIMRRHPQFGVEILKPLSELKDSMDGVRWHHERFDGKGYPDGLKGDQIPMIASIISVADAFDAMISDRPYRKGRSKREAVEEISACTGTQFSPKPAKALIELFEQGVL